MIEINLLPGATKKTKGRKATVSLGSAFSGIRARVKDPFMLSAVASVLIAASGIGGLYFLQSQKSAELAVREEQAVADSARFATVLAARRAAEAKRDSVLRQLQVIRSIDDDRFIWPHVMDEVSRALPPYTWLKSVSPMAPVLQPAPPPPSNPKNPNEPKKDPLLTSEPMRFRMVGNTVDIQALTRFMKLLESSPFIQNVQLARSDLAMVDGREVTEFQLDAEYERPDKSAITTAPVSLSVR
jgi:Tfp pilus assembly protein PilN